MDNCYLFFSNLCLVGTNHYGYIRKNNNNEFYILKDNLLEDYLKIFNTGVNGIRHLSYNCWLTTIDNMFTPFFYDSNLKKFDLLKFNDNYFNIYKEVLTILGNIGEKVNKNTEKIIVLYDLLDNCQNHFSAHETSPFFNNLQNISGTYNEITKEILVKLFERLWNIREELKETNIKLEFSLGNEIDSRQGRSIDGTWLYKDLIKKMKEINYLPFSYGACANLNEEHQTPLTALKCQQIDIENIFNNEEYKLLPFRPIHSCKDKNSQELLQFLQWWGNHPIRLLISNDGVWDGDNKCDGESEYKRYRNSPEQFTEIFKFIYDNYKFFWPGGILKDKPLFAFEYLPKSPTSNLNCQLEAIDLFAKYYFNFFGINLENRNNFKKHECYCWQKKVMNCQNNKEIVTHICVNNKWQETNEKCFEENNNNVNNNKETCFKKYIANRCICKWQVWKFLKCLFKK